MQKLNPTKTGVDFQRFIRPHPHTGRNVVIINSVELNILIGGRKMKILRNTVIVIVTLLAVGLVGWEAFLLTIFSTTQEFWFAGIALSAALIVFGLGLVFRRRARKSLTMGASLFFSLCATLILLTDFGSKEEGEYVARMAIALPQWHFDAFTYASMAFSVFPAALLLKKKADPVGTDNSGAAPRRV